MNQDTNITKSIDIDMSNITNSIISFHNNYIINSVKHICNLINLKYISIENHENTIIYSVQINEDDIQSYVLNINYMQYFDNQTEKDGSNRIHETNCMNNLNKIKERYIDIICSNICALNLLSNTDYT